MSVFNMILPVAQVAETVTSFPVSAEKDSYVVDNSYQYWMTAIGKGADTPARNENIYSTASGIYGHVKYFFNFSSVPDTATITEMSIKVKGHKENSDGYAAIVIRTDSEAWGSTSKEFAYTYTEGSEVITMPTITMTVAQLKEAYLYFSVGRDGGLIEGATWSVTYKA